jgi:hypothetical protein
MKITLYREAAPIIWYYFNMMKKIKLVFFITTTLYVNVEMRNVIFDD